MPKATDIQGTVYKKSSAILLARVVGNDDIAISQGSLSSIAYSIYTLDDAVPDSQVVVPGHDNMALTIADVVYSTLQTDSIWTVDSTGYNFRHSIDISSNEAFPIAGDRYQVRYELTPLTGQKIIVRFKLRCI